jgi:ceramide glucosyltransferase
MASTISVILFAGAGAGLLLLAAASLSLARHLSARCPARRSAPGVSVLKPLCGLDDALAANLASFAALDYPSFEVLLGVRSTVDDAYPVARAAAARWPGRFRVVVQRGEPGVNPKVNQLVTLERAARHPIVVVSDSNVRVGPGYLSEIVALLEDPGVGLVTHPIAGVGEERLGSVMDALHLAGCIAPGVVAAKRLAGRDFVVGKSIAMRRTDLAALGGFAVLKDVLAEDYVLGRLAPQRLGKRVAIAHSAVENVTTGRSVREFVSRYKRWGVLQRQAVGPACYTAQALLNPVLLAVAAFAISPRPGSACLLAATCAGKAVVDGVNGRRLRGRGFGLRQLALVPVKDLLSGWAWAYALAHDEVTWRGTTLRVQRGTRVEIARPAGDGVASAITTA